MEETLIPAYLRLSKYFDHHWGFFKYCANQFHGPRQNVTKAQAQALHQKLSAAKSYDAFADIIGSRTGGDEFREIEEAINLRPDRHLAALKLAEKVNNARLNATQSREPRAAIPRCADCAPNARRMPIPSVISGHDAVTPTPGGGVP
ncbi:hypothetical protein FIBSPDRAFT_935070 [Athelia psychrophila]|uniref:Uncharacterized protein n=1 Tax=Athelia psychrophila TaxID=1759441 RepID=A0A166EDK3_9AGAM|nr:hypothetical protein FIBSPDRAFT_935070 [Fibularhizoctonia sp. CBS 109695]